MSSTGSKVVIPTTTPTSGTPDMGGATAVKPMQGGMILSPANVITGGRRKTKRVSKKVLKMLKKMTPKQLKKMMKGGEDPEGEEISDDSEETTTEGARRKRKGGKSRKGKKSRSAMFY